MNNAVTHIEVISACQSPEGCRGINITADRNLLCDTGALHHCIPRDALTESELDTVCDLDELVALQTANDVMFATQSVQIYSHDLDMHFKFLVLDSSSPAVLSLFHLCYGDGIGYWWPPYSKQSYVHLLNGKVVECDASLDDMPSITALGLTEVFTQQGRVLGATEAPDPPRLSRLVPAPVHADEKVEALGDENKAADTYATLEAHDKGSLKVVDAQAMLEGSTDDSGVAADIMLMMWFPILLLFVIYVLIQILKILVLKRKFIVVT